MSDPTLPPEVSAYIARVLPNGFRTYGDLQSLLRMVERDHQEGKIDSSLVRQINDLAARKVLGPWAVPSRG